MVVLFSLLTTNVHATTYYVSPNGNNSNSTNSKSKPWRTIAFTAKKATKSGDVIMLLPGTFQETQPTYLASGVAITGSGKTGTNASIIQPVAGMTGEFDWMPNCAVIQIAQQASGNTLSNFAMDGNNWTNEVGISTQRLPNAAYNDYSQDSSNITVHDVNFSNFDQIGLWMQELSNGLVYNCNFTNCGYNGTVLLGMLTLGGARNTTVYNCTFTGTVTDTVNNMGMHCGFGIKLFDRPSLNCTIHDCTMNLPGSCNADGQVEPNLALEFAHVSAQNDIVYNITSNAAFSIVLDPNSSHNGYPYEGPGDAVHVYNSTITLQPNVGYAVEDAGDFVEVDHCYFNATNSQAFGNAGGFMAFANYGNNSTHTNMSIHHNVFNGFRFCLFGCNCSLNNFYLYNNTFYAASSGWQPTFNVLSIASQNYTNVTIANNVFFQDVNTVRPAANWFSWSDGLPKNITGDISNNCTFNIPLTNFAGLNTTHAQNITVNPKLKMSGVVPNPYFAPASTSSPVVNAGKTFPGFLGTYTGSAPNIGAY